MPLVHTESASKVSHVQKLALVHVASYCIGELRDGIVAGAAPGVAAEDAAQGQPAALEGPMLSQGFDCVLRAGGSKAAARPLEG